MLAFLTSHSLSPHLLPVRQPSDALFSSVARHQLQVSGLSRKEMGDVLTFFLTPANVDDRDPRVWQVFTKVLYGKVFADKGYIKQEFFENLFNQGIHLVHGIKSNMKNKLMPLWDKMMLRKRYIIECINELLKNKANLVHSRHHTVHNFLMNLCVRHWLHTVSSRISQRHCPRALKRLGNWNFSKQILIPNWRIDLDFS